MGYPKNVDALKNEYRGYVSAGMRHNQVLIGVLAGPPGYGVSVDHTRQITEWQPDAGEKLGMMLFTFSQDIQQFTASPQNDPHNKYPNPRDHEWQKTIIEAMGE